MDSEKGHEDSAVNAKENTLMDKIYNAPKPAIYACLVGAAVIPGAYGFIRSMRKLKKLDAVKTATPEAMQHLEDGSALGKKALAVATVLSVSGVSLFVLGMYKVFGVSNYQELHDKFREKYPKPKSEGRTDFKTLKDLADFLISEDRKAELRKKQEQQHQHKEEELNSEVR